jgi:diguanylate cyclase (GGDEF)-like protein
LSASGDARREAEPEAAKPGAETPFVDRLHGCLEQRKADGRSLAVLLLDCGLIGRIDDLWGYQVGDAVRGRIAARLRAEVLRPDDFIGEFGRDDLACALTLVEGPQLAVLAAEKALRTINTSMFLGEDEIYASPSVGIAVFPGSADSAESLLQQAKSASAAAAELSGHIALYDAGRSSGEAPLVAEGRLRTAIADDALELVFQPQYDVRFGQIMGMEAKLRWRDGNRSLVPMREAIAAAEAGGLVTKVISSLLNRALRNCSEFRQRAGLDLRVAINLPARCLLEPELPALVERALGTWSLRPGRLVLEIDELSVLASHEQARTAVQHLHQLGVKLSADDAHAPLSSLFWLATMPFKEVKVDLSTAPGWSGEPRSEGVLRSLIELVHQLKLDVIVTAVADEAEEARLPQLGCDFMQADFKGPPVDPENFVSRYAG